MPAYYTEISTREIHATHRRDRTRLKPLLPSLETRFSHLGRCQSQTNNNNKNSLLSLYPHSLSTKKIFKSSLLQLFNGRISASTRFRNRRPSRSTRSAQQGLPCQIAPCMRIFPLFSRKIIPRNNTKTLGFVLTRFCSL